MTPTKRYALICFFIYLVVGVSCSFSPIHRAAWLMENVMIVAFVGVLICLFIKGCILSRISYTILLAACVVHTIGAYYSFPNVPMGNWLKDLFDLSRNPYDRMGHFLCGTLAYPLMDIAMQREWFSSRLLAAVYQIFFILAIGTLYEIWEWLVIIYTEHTMGLIYVGAQGDEWDAQADLTCCLFGSICSVVLFCILYHKNNKHLCKKLL